MRGRSARLASLARVLSQLELPKRRLPRPRKLYGASWTADNYPRMPQTHKGTNAFAFNLIDHVQWSNFLSLLMFIS